MLGIIGGTSLLDYSGSDLEKILMHTPYGSSEILKGDRFCLLLRHQYGYAPHRVPYRSHISALKLAGVDRIIAIGSSGSLKEDISPGSLLIPSDFICLSPVPTIHNHSIGHINPVFDPVIRSFLAEIAPEAITGGTYLQTRGPRLETRSEIAWLSSQAHVVGMTLGSELSVSNELHIPFAAICTVDNYAHGICNAEISYESIVETIRKNQDKTRELLGQIISSAA